ncbi:ECF transporter S component [Enterococcus faecalis]|nr:ECF transporter S component [Enterococcus faecalis]
MLNLNYSTRKITIIAMLLTLCVVGANIKIIGSIALDSFPAFIGTLILGPVVGAFLGFSGHMISALLVGFPSTLPIHLIIAVLMALCMFVYGWIRNNWYPNTVKSLICSVVTAYLLNVPLSLSIIYLFLGKIVFILFIPLTIATVCNLLLSEFVYVTLPKKIKNFQY